jgi:uncharacterized protein (DUF1778 family)
MGSAATSKKRVENINLRVTKSQKALIDRAASVLERSRSDFMLDAACRAAESTLLDQVYFRLNGADFKKFMDMLDNPPAENPKLARLLQRKPQWEK